MRRGGWLLLAIILMTSCTLALTLGLFVRALPLRTGIDAGELKDVGIQYGGALRTLETTAVTVGELLNEQQIAVPTNALLSPAASERLSDGMVVVVKLPGEVTIVEDGREYTFETVLDNPLAILESADIAISGADKIWINGALANVQALPRWTIPARHIRIRRAAQLTIIDDGKQSAIVTNSDTIGQALFDAGVTLYLSDEVSPPLASAVSGAMTIRIKRAIPIQLMVDGVVIEARTNAAVVADALVKLNAPLFGLDYVIPPEDAAVSEGMTIEIVRVTEEIVSESETITHERRVQPDADIELDQSAVIQRGQDGRRETRYRVRYENGAEVSRVLSETLDVEVPVPEITAYGTKVVAQGTVNTPQGSRSYWRKLCVVATYYTPPPNITATGGEIYRGVVAAKRRFIPLYTQVYVPGYGEGTVLDTGAGPSSTIYWIDLGFSSAAEARQANAATRYTWVYLLWPPPADIIYRLPPWSPARKPVGNCA